MDSKGPSIDKAAKVRSGEELPSDQLQQYLSKHFPGNAGVDLTIRQFPSGFSNLTYLIEWGTQAYILRRPPFGAKVKSAHDMGREFRMLSHLRPVFPAVPKPLLYCEDAEVIGAPFYLMERVEGVILRAGMPKNEYPDAETMEGVARSFVENLAQMHSLDLDKSGLADLGKPEGYAQRQIEGWIKRYGGSRTHDIEDMTFTGDWLLANIPDSGTPALIHNDYKYDNLVLDPEDITRIKAVLDWEMATIGDPLMDLGTCLAYWVTTDDPDFMKNLNLNISHLPGNPDRATLAEWYFAARAEAPKDLIFYYVFGLYKIAVIIQQIYFRYEKGFTSDPRFAHIIEGVKAYGKAARLSIEKQRMDRLFDS